MLTLEDFVVTSVVEKSLGTLKINVIKADISFSNGKMFVGVMTSPTTVELFSISCKMNEKGNFDLNVEVFIYYVLILCLQHFPEIFWIPAFLGKM